ncbi:MAG: PQQ-binding-like beta-propeller repeat protein [Planctomycetota bacterium]|nr:PQQ-binding-like beta-propeller repeat protein [Planctomycetota bacterium]
MAQAPTGIQVRRTSSIVRGVLGASVVAVVAVGFAGCKNPNRPGRYRPPAESKAAAIRTPPPPAPAGTATAPTRAATAASTVRPVTPPKRATADAGPVRLVDAETAKQLGMRAGWQQRIPTRGSGGVKRVVLAGDDVVVIDRMNAMTVFGASSGELLWHEAPIPSREKIMGVARFYLESEDLLLVTTDTDLYLIGSDTGLQVGRQNLAQLPATESMKVGEYIIYGTARGRLIWHNIPVGFELKANGLDSRIAGLLAQQGNRTGATSVDGRVGVFDSNTAKRVWTKQLNAGFKYGPAMSDGMFFCADNGQRVLCFDSETGTQRWRYFSETPLTGSPLPLGDRVVQVAGDGGMLCLASEPGNTPQGRLLWRNPNVRGEVVTVLGDDLLVWNEDTRRLSRIDSTNGTIRLEVRLDNVDHVQATVDNAGRKVLLVSNRNGRVQRLDPRN